MQKRLHTPEELTHSIPSYIHTEMPQQHAEFFSGLAYLPICTVDKLGRPWASILTTQSESEVSTGIKLLEPGVIKLSSHMSSDDPFFRALKHANEEVADTPLLFAGVGVDFSNRRRNKLAGKITSIDLSENGRVSLQLNSDEHLGNCPKYITIRDLSPQHRDPELAFDNFDSFEEPLSAEAKTLINQASTVFLATKHVPNSFDDNTDQADMGLNHRGGAPGFVRAYEEPTTPDIDNGLVKSYLVLPDFSGNRFYQSLGNIESSQLTGMAFPNFLTGDMLYVTGVAENLFDADAQALMPRVSLLTRVRITGAVLIRGALGLRLESDEQLSPYNPPVRYLRRELDKIGHANGSIIIESEHTRVKLVSVKKNTSRVSTFRFELVKPIDSPLPGGFGVLDFSELLSTGYSHMNEANPQAVNEDYIRTWTLSSAPQFDLQRHRFKPVNHIDITVKHQEKGLVSNFLHKNALALMGEHEPMIRLKGIGGNFSCFDFAKEGSAPVVPEKMLWLAGGVGITPFMSMWNALLTMGEAYFDSMNPVSIDILLVFIGRGDDVAILRHFLSDVGPATHSVKMKVIAYQSDGDRPQSDCAEIDSLKHDFPNANLTTYKRRMDITELSDLDGLFDLETFICGPEALMNSASKWLESQSKGRQRIHLESYVF